MKLVLSTAALGAALVLAATAPIGAQSAGESGRAVLRDTKAGLVVMLTLTGGKGIQPAHIHKGSCAKLDPKPWYPLKNVINGKSTTTIAGVTIGEIIGKSAINVHKSLKEIPVYVACGDVAK
jgi:hypothetical protein